MSKVLGNTVSLDPFAESVSNAHHVKTHITGTENVLYQEIPFDSYSDSGATVRIKPPSIDSIMDKRIYVEFPMTVTATGGLNDGAPRAFPINNIITNCTLTINGVSTTSRPQLEISPFSRYNTSGEFRSQYYGLTPSQLDPVNNYDLCKGFTGGDATAIQGGDPAAADDELIYGSTSNLIVRDDVVTDIEAAHFRLVSANPNSPFCPTETYNKHDEEVSRAQFPYTISATRDTGRTYVFVEPLLHGLLGDYEEEGLAMIRELQIQLNFDSVLTKLWSSPAAAAGLAVAFTSTPKVYVQFRRPSMQIPPQLTIPFRDYVHQQKEIGTLTATALTGISPDAVTMNNIVLSQVPSKIWIWAKRRESTRTYRHADGFLRLDSINMTIGTRTGLLTNLNSRRLYQMSVDNGLTGVSYLQWQKRLGSPLLIDVAKDLGGLDVSYVGNFSMSFTANFTDTTFSTFADAVGVAIDWDLHMLAQLDGTATITPDSMLLSRGFSLQDESEVSEMKQSIGQASEGDEMVDVEGSGKLGGYRKHQYGHGVSGGGLFSFARRILRRALPIANAVAPLVSKDPRVSTGLNVLNSVAGSGKLGAGRLMA